MNDTSKPASVLGADDPEPGNSLLLAAFDEGGQAALTALAASFAKAGNWDASNTTLRALSKIAPTCPCCRAIEGVTSHSGGCRS